MYLVTEKDIPISIHALLAESDLDYKGICVQNLEFLSTLSLRRATIFAARKAAIRVFLSTLSLRRATWPYLFCRRSLSYFYPRSPCGERLPIRSARHVLAHFYPRSPCGERLKIIPGAQRQPPISIHALLAESDSAAQCVFNNHS